MTILDNLQPGIDKSIIKREVKQLEEHMKELDEITTRLVETSDNAEQARAFEVTLEEFEAIAVRAKQDAYKLVSEIRGSSVASSRSGRRSVHSRASRNGEEE